MQESMGWDVGQKLRYLRMQRHITQEALAEHVHLVSQAHVSNMETGRFEPSLDVLLALSNLFRVQLDYFLNDGLPPDTAEHYHRPGDDLLAMQHFGPTLARLRRTAGLTQTQLANQLGLAAHAHISFLERGRKQPSPDLALRAAQLFAVPLDQLFQAPAL